MREWDGLDPPYRTIVADPPWQYEQGGPQPTTAFASPLRPPPYSTMPVEEICLLPVSDLVGEHAHLYLWTTNRYLPAAYEVVGAWGTWFAWPRRGHSVKPPEFLDLVERVSPGPYVELFARQPRLGWDHWGYGYEGTP